MNHKPTITTFQLTFILIHAQVGVGFLSLPHDIFKKAGPDSWIVVLATGIIVQLFIFIYGMLIKRFPNNNLFEIARILLGKVIGNIIIVFLSMYYIFFAVIILTEFAYLLNAWMTPHTPRWVIIALMCVTTLFIVKENIQIIARFIVIASVVFTGFIISALYVLKHATFSYLLPVGAHGIMPIIEGMSNIYSYFGFELLLILHPFVRSANKGIIRAASIANIFITCFYLLLVVVTVASFTAKEMLIIPEPVLFLIKAISFSIIERPDLFFTSMWIALVVTTVTSIIYTSSLGIATFINSVHIKYIAIIVIAVSFIGAVPSDDSFKIDALTSFGQNFILPIVWGLPILLLIISIMFNKKEAVKNH